jgi:hypothetical protein
MTDADATSLEERVRRWFAGSGYPLEMRVASLISQRGFSVYQSDYYLDPDLKEQREIDVVGLDELRIDGGRFRLTVAIECKTSRDKPWLVLSSAQSDRDGPKHVEDRSASRAGMEFLRRVCDRSDIQELAIFRQPARNGYSVVRAFGEGPDIPYAAMMSASKAARAIAEEASHVRADYVVAEIILPVVVLDGRLFEAYLTRDGETIMSETSRALVYWRNPVAGNIHSVVSVMTFTALDSFVDDVRVGFDTLVSSCRNELNAAVAVVHASKAKPSQFSTRAPGV